MSSNILTCFHAEMQHCVEHVVLYGQPSAPSLAFFGGDTYVVFVCTQGDSRVGFCVLPHGNFVKLFAVFGYSSV